MTGDEILHQTSPRLFFFKASPRSAFLHLFAPHFCSANVYFLSRPRPKTKFILPRNRIPIQRLGNHDDYTLLMTCIRIYTRNPIRLIMVYGGCHTLHYALDTSFTNFQEWIILSKPLSPPFARITHAINQPNNRTNTSITTPTNRANIIIFIEPTSRRPISNAYSLHSRNGRKSLALCSRADRI